MPLVLFSHPSSFISYNFSTSLHPFTLSLPPTSLTFHPSSLIPPHSLLTIHPPSHIFVFCPLDHFTVWSLSQINPSLPPNSSLYNTARRCCRTVHWIRICNYYKEVSLLWIYRFYNRPTDKWIFFIMKFLSSIYLYSGRALRRRDFLSVPRS